MNGSLGLVSLIFILLSLLFALNNQEISSRMNLLLGLTVLYFLAMSIHIQSFLSDSNEPVRLLYTLPVAKKTLFFGIFIPGVIWVLTMSVCMFILSLTAGIRVESGLTFFYKAICTGIAFLNMSSVEAVNHYPSDKLIKRKLFTSFALLSLVLILLYPYWSPIVLFWSALSLLKLQKKRTFYKSEI